MTGCMHIVRKWIVAGCSPAHENAPPIDILRKLEREDLIMRVETIGATYPRWLLTSAGFYEADRAQHAADLGGSSIKKWARSTDRDTRDTPKGAT